jgi:hypothetical protein
MINFKVLDDIDFPFGTTFRIALTSDWDVITVDFVDSNITREQYLPYIESLNEIAIADGFKSFTDMFVEVPDSIMCHDALYDYLASL